MSELFLVATDGVGCYPEFYTTVATTKEDAEHTIRMMGKGEDYSHFFGDGIKKVIIKDKSIRIVYDNYDGLLENECMHWSLVPITTYNKES